MIVRLIAPLIIEKVYFELFQLISGLVIPKTATPMRAVKPVKIEYPVKTLVMIILLF